MTIPPPAADRAHDILRAKRRSLDELFVPKTIAVIGATEEASSAGRIVLWNLISSPFGGTVFPVNPKRGSVLGVAAYPKVSAIPAAVDLAIIATPAPTVPELIRECAEAGVKGALVFAPGFRETGPAGLALEQQLLTEVRRGGMRLIGPNCLGVMRPHRGLNATFARSMARPGHVAFVSQSGALGTAVLDWSLDEGVGFSAFLSVGSMLDVGWGDLIDYLGDDPQTQSIILYMESIGDARSFLSAAREVALTKPIIVLKAGRTAGAAQAAVSHTGSLAGSDAILDTAFRRSGVLRVNSVAELFHMAEVLSRQPYPQQPRLTIVTNAGGPGVIAADALLESGGQLAQLAPATNERLNQALPQHWSHGNPVDLQSDAGAQRYAQALEIVAQDEGSDGLLVILTPQVMSEPEATAEVLKPYAKRTGKPLLASWMGGAFKNNGEKILNAANIPTFNFPDTAAQTFTAMWRYRDVLRRLYETPMLPAADMPDRATAASCIQTARQAGRTLLTEVEAKRVLTAYCIPTVETHSAFTVDEAVAHAESLGYPVVVKLFSQTITHKSDVGGVRLNLADADAVRRAFGAIKAAVTERVGAEHFNGVTVQHMAQSAGYELILGSTIDPQFGPVLLFGAGGQLVEVFDDVALALPPLNTTLARRLVERTRIFGALGGVRGKPPVDLAELDRLLTRFSYLVVEQPWIKEIDVNPLLASVEAGNCEHALLALDARIVLHPPDTDPASLPRPAIRPYPTQYVCQWKLKDGTPVTIRPIRPEDEPLMVKFHQTLSERSVFMRYFTPMALDIRTAHERLTRMCFIDYDREIALVVDREDPQTGEHQIIAVARLIKLHGKNEAEFAGLVSDEFQGHSLGTELLRQLIRIARDEQLDRIVAETLPENLGMRRVFEKLGFRVRLIMSEDIVKAELDL